MPVLFVLTSNDRLGDTGKLTGTWLEELASAYYVLEDAGHEVELASIQGGSAPLDPASLEGEWLTDSGKRFLADTVAMAKLGSTKPVGAIDPGACAAIYLVGGAGTAWDFPDNRTLARLVSELHRTGSPIGAVCHGVLGLTGAADGSGAPIVRGRGVTAVSNAEEGILGLNKIVPVLPETRLTELGGKYSAAATPFSHHIVIDGNLLTGQNPASAPKLAQAIAERLR